MPLSKEETETLTAARAALTTAGEALDAILAPVEPADPEGDVSATAPLVRGGKKPQAGAIELALYPGRNNLERAVAAVRATHPGGKDMPDDDVFVLACEGRRLGKFVDVEGSP